MKKFGVLPARFAGRALATAMAVAVTAGPSTDAARAQAPLRGKIGYAVAMVSPAGVYTFVRGKWGILHVYLTNPTDQPIELLAATYFEGEPTLQYGRRVWLPPRSRLQTWHPVRVPAVAGDRRRQIDFRTLVMDTSEDREVMIRTDSGYLQLDGILRVSEVKPITGFIESLDGNMTPERQSAFDLLMTARARGSDCRGTWRSSPTRSSLPAKKPWTRSTSS